LWVSRHAWLHCLHALEMKELSYSMTWQFKGHKKDSIIILDVVDDHETWISHAF
jgi:hypothetical protein